MGFWTKVMDAGTRTDPPVAAKERSVPREPVRIDWMLRDLGVDPNAPTEVVLAKLGLRHAYELPVLAELVRVKDIACRQALSLLLNAIRNLPPVFPPKGHGVQKIRRYDSDGTAADRMLIDRMLMTAVGWRLHSEHTVMVPASGSFSYRYAFNRRRVFVRTWVHD